MFLLKLYTFSPFYGNFPHSVANYGKLLHFTVCFHHSTVQTRFHSSTTNMHDMIRILYYRIQIKNIRPHYTMSANGLITSKDVNGTANPDSSYFIRKADPLIVDTLVANTLVSDTLNLNEGVLTTTDGGTILTLNGVPVGGGGGGAVDAVQVSAPITLSGTTELPVIGLDQSGLVQTTGAQSVGGIKTFTVLPRTSIAPTLDSQLVNKEYADGVAAEWSTYPALGTVDMAGFSMTGVGDITGTTADIVISAALDITLKSDEGNVVVDARNFTLIANAPPGQDVSDSALTISTDNDMALTATDRLEITAGSMLVNNEMSMTSHKITNVLNPTDAQDVATKAYVDGALPGADPLSVVLAVGNSAGTSEINMNANKIVGCVDPTEPQDVATKQYVDSRPVDTLSAVLTVGNTASTEINMSGYGIINLPIPVADADAATKQYVDSRPAPPIPTLSEVLTSGNTASGDIDMAGFDISAVNDLTMSGTLPTITATNIAGNLVISALNTMSLGTAGLMTIASGGILSLGGATHTTLENLLINNSVIGKVNESVNDLTFNDVANISAGANTQLSINGPQGLIMYGGESNKPITLQNFPDNNTIIAENLIQNSLYQ